jgi:U3 small nucleolar RNA-associated protein 13
VWDAARGYCTHALKGHESPVLCVVFHPHARRLLLFSASEDTTVRCWDLAAKGACAAVLRGHFSAVTSLAVACGGSSGASPGHLLSAGRDKVVTVWRLADYAKAATVPAYEALEGVVALPAGAPVPGAAPASSQATAQANAGELAAVRFATAGERGTLRVWAAAGAACLHEAARDPGAAAKEAGFTSLHLLPSAAGFAVTTSDCRVLFYAPEVVDAAAAKPGKSKADAPAPRLLLSRQLLGDLDEVVDARFLPPVGSDGPDAPPLSLVVATNSAVLSVLDARTLACTASLAGHADTVLCLDAASTAAAAGARAPRTAQLVVSAGKDRSLRLWDAAAGRCLASAEGHAAAVTAVAFGTRSAALLVTGGADKLLKVWDASAAIAAAASTEPAPEGAKLLRVTAAVAAHEKEVNAVAVAPTDALVASGGADRLIKLWALPSLLPRGTLRGHKRGVWSLAFSPLDAVLASASGDRTLRLWNCVDGSCVRTLEGHAAGVLKVTWLTAGTQLASGGADGCVRVWSVAGGESLAALEAHDGRAWALAAAADGASLLSGGADGALRLWRDSTAETAAAAAAAEDAAAADEQALSNATRAGNFGAALALGLRLGRPKALHALLTARLAAGGAGLDDAVAALPEEALGALLAHCAEWNANSRTCAVAQAALAALLRAVPPSRVARLPNAAALLDALHAYTQRHFARMDRLVRATYLLDFTLAQQGALVDSDEDDDTLANASDLDAPHATVEVLRAAAGVRAAPMSAARAAAKRAAADTLRGDDDDFGDVALPGWGAGGGDGGGDASSSEEEEEEEAPPPPVKRKRARAAEEDSPAAKAPAAKTHKAAAPEAVVKEAPAAATKARKAATAVPVAVVVEAEPAPRAAKRGAAAKEAAPAAASKARKAAKQAAEEAEEAAPAKRASAKDRKTAAEAGADVPPPGQERRSTRGQAGRR